MTQLNIWLTCVKPCIFGEENPELYIPRNAAVLKDTLSWFLRHSKDLAYSSEQWICRFG